MLGAGESGILWLHDKNDPLFCGFAAANFFATWGNARFSRDFEQKSTEKYPVFISRLTRPVAAPQLEPPRRLPSLFATPTGFPCCCLLMLLPSACGSRAASLGVIVVACAAAFHCSNCIVAATN